MAERQLILPGNIVKKSNAAARARWGSGSVWEKRLVAQVAALVRTDDVEFQEYEIPVAKLLRPGDDGGKIHNLVEETAELLMSRVITLPLPKKGWAKYNVFSRCVYDRERGVLNARFDPDMKPHYLALKSHFTEYGIIEFLMLPSTYSQDLFELLKSWCDKPEVTVDLSYLHEQFDCPTALRSNFAAFRRRVLEKAHKDIHKLTALKYEWEPIKKGKAVVAVRFVFGGKRRQAVKVEKEEAAKVAGKRPVRVSFQAAPPADVRDALKAQGFKWSPEASAWEHTGLAQTQANKVFQLVVPVGGKVSYAKDEQ